MCFCFILGYQGDSIAVEIILCFKTSISAKLGNGNV